MAKITGQFDTRRDAELAVERIVQEHDVKRENVQVAPAGPRNTVGTRPAGADAKEKPEPEGDEKLEGAIEVVVQASNGPQIADAMRAAGGYSLQVD